MNSLHHLKATLLIYLIYTPGDQYKHTGIQAKIMEHQSLLKIDILENLRYLIKDYPMF